MAARHAFSPTPTPSCKPSLPSCAAEMSSPSFPTAVSAASTKNFPRACANWQGSDEILSLVPSRVSPGMLRRALHFLGDRSTVVPPNLLHDLAHFARAVK